MEIIGIAEPIAWIIASSNKGKVLAVFEHVINCFFENQVINITDKTIPWNPISIKTNLETGFVGYEIKPGDEITSDNEKIYIGKLSLPICSKIEIFDCKFKYDSLVPKKVICNLIFREIKKWNGNGIALAIINTDQCDAATKWLRKAYIEFSDCLSNKKIKDMVPVIRKLIGAGCGLTPSGDDFLCGALYALYSYGDNEYCNEIINIIKYGIEHEIQNTTKISAAFLEQAMCRNASEYILQLFTHNTEKEYEQLIQKIMKIGHSSGLDMLCGCWLIFNVIGGNNEIL